MDFIKDKSGKIVLAFDGDNLYFHSQEPDEDSDFKESISIEQLKVENNGGLKLYTILDLQEERDIISDTNYIINKIKNTIPYLAQIISEHEESISSLEERIVLLEMEGSGPASAWMDYLFLNDSNQTFDLCSSRKGYLSASEIIEYYGLGDEKYWDQIQANGEFFIEEILEIKNGKELHDVIVLLLENEEQWNIMKDDIDWAKIVDVLFHNKATLKLGIELKSLISND